METLTKILILLITALLLFTGAFVFFTTRITPEVIELNRETSKLRAETEKLQAEESLVAATLRAEMAKTDLKLRQVVKQSWVYQYSLAVQFALVNLWPAWVLLIGLTVAYSQRSRFRKYVHYSDDLIETVVRDGQQTALVRERYRVLEMEKAHEIVKFDAVEAATNHRLRSTMDIVRTLKGSSRELKKSSEILEAIPALPVNVPGRFSMSDLLSDPDLEPGYLPLGRNAETGQIAQARPKDLICIDLIGKQGFCKTTIFNLLTMGFLKLQEEGHELEMYLIDPHAGLPESAATFLKPVLSRFKKTILGENAIERGDHITLLREIGEELNRRQSQGYVSPYLVLLVDEMHDIFDVDEHAKEFFRILKKIRRLRKAGVFQVLVHHDSTREGAANLGTGLMNLSVSAFVVNCTKSKAAKVLENGDAEKAVDLERGKAVLKIPGGENEILQLPFVSPADLSPFLEREKPLETPVSIGEVTPSVMKMYIEERKKEDPKFGQNRLGEMVRISKKDMSLVMNGKRSLSEEERERLKTVIFGKEVANVIPLEKYRSAP